MHILTVKLQLATYSNFIVTLTAINCSATKWFKGYFGVSATFGTSRGKHLALGIVAVTVVPKVIAVVSVLSRFPCLAAYGASFWHVSIAS